MELALDASQEALRKDVRELLAAECPPSHVRELERSEAGYSEVLWREMGNRGWLGLAFPDAVGGGGRGLVDQAVVAEEIGRAACPLPFQTSIAQSAFALLELGDATRCARLPSILSGELRLSLCLVEPSASYEPGGIQLSGRLDSAGWVLEGVKRFVAFASSADVLLVAARTASGISLFWVEADRPGIALRPLDAIGDDAPCELRFDGVRLPREALVGGEGDAWSPLERAVLVRATALLCAQMAGGARAALELATDYAKRREQFGRPIGSFQAVQHRAADMLMDVDAAQLATYEAASRIDAGLPHELEVSQAKVICSQAYTRVTASGQQILGGVGFYADMDMGLWYRRARALAVQLGDVELHRERIAQRLGL